MQHPCQSHTSMLPIFERSVFGITIFWSMSSFTCETEEHISCMQGTKLHLTSRKYVQ